MLGNVIEWIHDKYQDPAQMSCGEGEAMKHEIVSDHQIRAMRPSTYAWHTGQYARCAESNVYVPPNAGILNNGFRVGRTFADPSSEDVVENNQARVMRGVSFVHSSAPNRASYRVRYSPNFGMIPWGLRAARTID
jgi:formylglycine-generating enzyme required for sulfatase activity